MGLFDDVQSPSSRTSFTTKSIGGLFSDVSVNSAKVSSSASTQESESEKFSLKSFAGSVVKDIVLAIPRALTAPFAIVSEEVPALLGRKKATSNKLSQFSFRDTDPGTKARAGAALESAFDVGTALLGGSLAKSTLKEAGKTGVLQAVKTAVLTDSPKTLAKRTVMDSAIGGGFGFAVGLQEDEVNKESLITSTLLGSVMGIVAPPLFELGIKGTVFSGKVLANNVKNVLDDAATKLEIKAGRSISELKAIDYFTLKPDTIAPKTFSEKIAGVTANSLRLIERIPSTAKRSVFRQAPIEDVTKTLTKSGKITENEAIEIVESFQRISQRSSAIASEKVIQYAKAVTGGNLKEKGRSDIHFYTKQYLRFLDAFDRINLNQSIEGGLTEEQLTTRFLSFKSNLEKSGTIDEIKKNVRDVHKIMNDLLEEAHKLGRITDDDFNNIMLSHPNYVPHDILSEALGGEEQFIGRSFGEKAQKLKKAKGSERQIEDIDIAISKVLFNETYKNEKQKAANAFFNAVEGDEDLFKITKLKTAEQVVEMKNKMRKIREEIVNERQLQRELRKDKKLSITNQKKASKALTDLEIIEKELVETVNKFFADDERRTFQKVIEETSSLPKIPNELLPFAKNIKEFATLKQFEESSLYRKLEAAVNNGIFERAGFSGKPETELKNFYHAAKSEFKVTPASKKKITEKAPTGSFLSKLARSQNVAKDKVEKVLSIDQISIDDAVKFTEARIESIKETKKQLRKELSDISPDTLSSLDIPKNKRRFRRVKDGIEEEYLMEEDLANALQNLGEKWTETAINWSRNSMIGKTATGPARLLRGIATVFNPSFLFLTNPIRDVQTAKMFSKFGAKDLGEALISTIWKGDEIKGALHRQASKEGLFLSGLYKEFDTAESVFNEALRKGEILGKTKLQKALTPVQVLKDAGSVYEESVRLAVFRKALKEGMPPAVAVREAANATVDFGRKGDLSELINMYVPFFNAGVQGSLNFARMIGKDPQGILRKGMLLAGIPTVAVHEYNKQFESRKNIPDWEQQMFWNIIISESEGRDSNGNKILVPHYIRIPKGVPTQLFSYAIQTVLNRGEEIDPKTMAEFTKDILRTQNPVATEQSIGAVIPSGAKLLIELQTNHSFFRDKAIEPEWVKRKGKWYKSTELPPEERFSEATTSEISIMVGEALGWSPSKIDYVIKQGMLKDFVYGFDIALRTEEKKKELEKDRLGRDANFFEKLSGVPFVQKFFGSSYYGQIEKEREKELEELRKENKDILDNSGIPFVERLRKKK